jgi:type I restriction enzyme S subunit
MDSSTLRTSLRYSMPWMPNCPGHWTIVRPKTIFHRMQRPVRPEDGVVTAFRDGVVTLRSNRRTTGFTEALQEIGYQGIRKGDLVIHAMDAFAGAIGVSDSDGKGTPVYSVCQPTGRANSWYFALVLREMSRSGYLLSLAKGIRERSTDFRFSDFAALEVPLPPLDEQEQIVRFVQQLDSRVNRLIKAKRRLIELLNEQKQAIIHQAVTRGLDPTVPLKPSGIDWLGEIPATWELRKIKELAIHNPSKSEVRGLAAETRVTLLPMEAVSEWGVVDTKFIEKFESVQDGLTYMRNGDVSIAKITPCFENGKGAPLVGLPFGFAFGSTEFHVLRPLSELSSAFLYFVTRMPKFRELGELNMKGSAGQKRVPSDFVKNFEFGLPGPAEQDQIVSHLRQALAGIDKTVDKVRAEIELIREYRTRLVADVVTGQLDVRHHPWANSELAEPLEVMASSEEAEEDDETIEPEDEE